MLNTNFIKKGIIFDLSCDCGKKFSINLSLLAQQEISELKKKLETKITSVDLFYLDRTELLELTKLTNVVTLLEKIKLIKHDKSFVNSCTRYDLSGIKFKKCYQCTCDERLKCSQNAIKLQNKMCSLEMISFV